MNRKPRVPLRRSILDSEFVYVPASGTDIRKTFERLAREQAADADRRAVQAIQKARVRS